MLNVNVNYAHIYNLHVSKIKESVKNTDIVNSIIDDMLMKKVSIKNDKIYVNINKTVLNLINDWYDFSNELQKYNKSSIIVYRGIKNIDVKDSFLHPIPFSTCIDYDNALNWINFNDLERSFIFKIHVDPQTTYTFTGNVNEGHEVVLPAGVLNAINTYYEDDVKIVECSFKAFSRNEMLSNLNRIQVENEN